MKTVVGVLAAALNSLTEDDLESIRTVARRVRDLASHVMKTVREVEEHDGASS